MNSLQEKSLLKKIFLMESKKKKKIPSEYQNIILLINK